MVRALFIASLFFAAPFVFAENLTPSIRFIITDILGKELPSNSATLSDIIQIQVEGLPPQAEVTLQLGMGDNQSSAVFLSDAAGMIDTATQAPLSGSYSGVDVDGLIWSMRPGKARPDRKGLDLHLDVLVGSGQLLSSAKLKRQFPSPSVSSKMITDQGFIGQLFLPPGAGPFPVLIILGGGEGGLSGSSFLAAYFASRGYASLAVAYFGLNGLPQGIDRLPLEYFKTAIDWVKSQPFAQGQPLAINGGSRGAEAALAIASTFDVFDAVISDLGNALPVSGYDFRSKQEVSPWTYQDRDLPFQKNILLGQETWRTHPNGIKAFEFKSTRNWEILNDSAAIDKAILRVENISAPILFNTADDDALWPSTPLSRVAFDRRARLGVGKNDEFYSYANVGHVLGLPPGLPAAETYLLFPGTNDYWELGGLPQNNARAQRESLRKNVLFLDKYLGSP